MNTYALLARLLGPVAIKRDRQSERSESARSIPGTTLRGALATVYLQHHGEPDDRFNRLFLDEDAARFGPLDPTPNLFPLTAAACKRHGVTHALLDHLWFRIAQHLAGGALPADTLTTWQQCARCGADLKNQTGFWWVQNGRVVEAETERHQVSAHVGIDRHTSTAADGIFYTLEAMAPSDHAPDLVGWVRLRDDAREGLQQLLDSEDGIVSVGHHRTRGYGRVRLQLVEHPNHSEAAVNVQQWSDWNDSLHAFLQTVLSQEAVRERHAVATHTGLDPGRDFLFALSFPSGVLFVDRVLRASTDPAEMIAWLPPLPDPDSLFPVQKRPQVTLPEGGTIRSMVAVTQHQLLRGWNAAHGLPRQDDWMVARGAVYAYWFQGTAAQRQALCQRLDDLAQTGIGLRRNEGYGRVIVSDPFHSTYSRQENSA